jgi:hypothetical protein
VHVAPEKIGVGARVHRTLIGANPPPHVAAFTPQRGPSQFLSLMPRVAPRPRPGSRRAR